MAHQVVSWVFNEATEELKGPDLIVALALAEHASRDGCKAFPSVKRLAKMSRMSERSVKRCLQKLLKLEIVKDHKRASRYTPTVYCFPAIAGETCVSYREVRGDKAVSPLAQMRGDKADARGDTAVVPGVTNRACRGDTALSPEPSSGTVNEPSVDPDQETAKMTEPVNDRFVAWQRKDEAEWRRAATRSGLL